METTENAGGKGNRSAAILLHAVRSEKKVKVRFSMEEKKKNNKAVVSGSGSVHFDVHKALGKHGSRFLRTDDTQNSVWFQVKRGASGHGCPLTVRQGREKKQNETKERKKENLKKCM